MTCAFELDHVQLAIPAGGEAAARAFFGGLLGLDEIAKPAELAARGGCWFTLGAHQLHLGVAADFRPAKKALVGIATGDLAGLRARFEQAGIATRDDVPVFDRERFFADDPFGNRLEFIESAA